MRWKILHNSEKCNLRLGKFCRTWKMDHVKLVRGVGGDEAWRIEIECFFCLFSLPITKDWLILEFLCRMRKHYNLYWADPDFILKALQWQSCIRFSLNLCKIWNSTESKAEWKLWESIEKKKRSYEFLKLAETMQNSIYHFLNHRASTISKKSTTHKSRAYKNEWKIYIFCS